MSSSVFNNQIGCGAAGPLNRQHHIRLILVLANDKNVQ